MRERNFEKYATNSVKKKKKKKKRKKKKLY